MDFEALLRQVKGAIFNDPTTPHNEGNDPSGLIGQIESIFGQFSGQHRQQQDSPYGNVRPASEDPLGDPADAFPQQQSAYPVQGQQSTYDPRYGNIKPASEDPLGDPADGEFGNVRPASEDPLGDPADEENNPRRRGWLG